jgi:hypothetical protein
MIVPKTISCLLLNDTKNKNDRCFNPSVSLLPVTRIAAAPSLNNMALKYYRDYTFFENEEYIIQHIRIKTFAFASDLTNYIGKF